MFPTCNGDVRLDQNRLYQIGLGLRSYMKCTLCNYQSSSCRKFYEEIQNHDNGGKRVKGQISPKINVQLQVALTKEPIGNTALRNIFATCDINPPAESGMQKLANKVNPQIHDINTEQLRLNRKHIKHVMRCRNDGKNVPIAVEADSAYNNPIKGRSFYQPDTQSWCPVFSGEAGLELPVAFSTRSKICSCPGSRDGHHIDTCSKDFPSYKAMGSSEKELGNDCGKQMLSDGPSIGTIVGDGDGHIFQGMKEALDGSSGVTLEREHCSRQLTKSIYRNLIKATFSLQCIPGRTQAIRFARKKAFAKLIQKRSAWEFKEAHRRFGHDIDILVAKCNGLVEGIFACIEGDVQTCKRLSLVCKIHKKKGVHRVSAFRLGFEL